MSSLESNNRVSLPAWLGRGLTAVKALSLIHISEPTRQEAISYAVFCLKKKNERYTWNGIEGSDGIILDIIVCGL